MKTKTFVLFYETFFYKKWNIMEYVTSFKMISLIYPVEIIVKINIWSNYTNPWNHLRKIFYQDTNHNSCSCCSMIFMCIVG